MWHRDAFPAQHQDAAEDARPAASLEVTWHSQWLMSQTKIKKWLDAELRVTLSHAGTYLKTWGPLRSRGGLQEGRRKTSWTCDSRRQRGRHPANHTHPHTLFTKDFISLFIHYGHFDEIIHLNRRHLTFAFLRSHKHVRSSDHTYSPLHTSLYSSGSICHVADSTFDVLEHNIPCFHVAVRLCQSEL